MKRIEKLKLKFIMWFDTIFENKYCWADCVSWVHGKRWNPFKIDKGCSSDKGVCYCGRFANGKAISTMTAEELEKLKNL